MTAPLVFRGKLLVETAEGAICVDDTYLDDELEPLQGKHVRITVEDMDAREPMAIAPGDVGDLAAVLGSARAAERPSVFHRDRPVVWICPLCQREATGRACPNGHPLPAPAAELVELVEWILSASEDADVSRLAGEVLAILVPKEAP